MPQASKVPFVLTVAVICKLCIRAKLLQHTHTHTARQDSAHLSKLLYNGQDMLDRFPFVQQSRQGPTGFNSQQTNRILICKQAVFAADFGNISTQRCIQTNAAAYRLVSDLEIEG